VYLISPANSHSKTPNM